MKKNIIRGVTIAIIGIIAFWVGGFFLIIHGSEWSEVEKTILDNEQVHLITGGNIKNVRPHIWGFQYRFGGGRGYANFHAEVDAVGGTHKFVFELERIHGQWILINLREKN